MKVKTKFGISDGAEEAIVLVFANDEERIAFAKNLINNFTAKPGHQRKMGTFPHGVSVEMQKDFMNFGEDIKDDNSFQLIPFGKKKQMRMIISIKVTDLDVHGAQKKVSALMKRYKQKQRNSIV